MRKADFVAVAKALRDGRDAIVSSCPEANTESTARIHYSTCATIAAVLAKQNPKFNRDKFLAVCEASQC